MITKKTVLIGITYLAFIMLGIPGAMLGVAWPSIRHSFDIPLDYLGILLLAGTIGYTLVSFSSGYFINQMGIGLFLLLSSIIKVAGLFGYALAPTWVIMVFSGFAVGIGGGAVDTGLNAYVAMNHSPRVMNWLHASFGLGATIGPLIITAVFNQEQPWQLGYIIVAFLQIGLVICFSLTLKHWETPTVNTTNFEPELATTQISKSDTLKLGAVWLSVLLFFIYAGLEGSAGQWSYTLFTEGRSIPSSVAGVWVSIYWGTFTFGRIVSGFVVNHIGSTPLLRLCMGGATLSALLIWLNISPSLSFVGLAVLGLFFAPVFPTLVSNTPKQFGKHHAANIIGFQIGSASLGIALLPGAIGILASNFGLEIIGLCLVIASIFMIFLHEKIIYDAFKAIKGTFY